jgi:hypothetical protein
MKRPRFSLGRWGGGRVVLSPDKSRANERATLSIRQSRGLPAPPHVAPKVTLITVCALLAVAAGCGDEGVAENATVSVYVSAPLCAAAKREVARSDGRAGDVRLRVACVDDVGGSGESRLAAIGAAARRATEDSSAVAYIGTPEPAATRFSEPILDEADIPRISASSGDAGMARLLRALRRADGSGSLRESLRDELR